MRMAVAPGDGDERKEYSRAAVTERSSIAANEGLRFSARACIAPESRRAKMQALPSRLESMAAKSKKKIYTVRTSDIHGRGVFAAEKIRKGTVIIEYKGERASWDEAMDRPDSDPTDSAHTFLFELDDGRLIDARVRGNAARWINHSCDPNCETFEDGKGRVFIEAKRKIHPGEELSYDYKLQLGGRLTKRERAQYTCRCGTDKCRGSLLDDGS
jgi:uncharacterized protein